LWDILLLIVNGKMHHENIFYSSAAKRDNTGFVIDD